MEALLSSKQQSQSSPLNLKLLIFIFIFFVASIIATVFITKGVVENNSSSADSSNINEKTPKNLIIVISDGMGQTYNAAYRQYKNMNETLIDEYFKGRYSTAPTNKNGITDSAAGGTVFAIGEQTHNSHIGLDAFGNPRGSILAAAKRQGKGTGLVLTKSVTDATPAAFSAYSLDRNWEEMISKQQATRTINGKPMLDILLGGGRRYQNISKFNMNPSELTNITQYHIF